MNPVAESGETYLNADVAYSGTGDIVWYTFEFEDPYDATAVKPLEVPLNISAVLNCSLQVFGDLRVCWDLWPRRRRQ